MNERTIRFKAAFRSKTNNLKIYKKRRTNAAVPLRQVYVILQGARSTGDLPDDFVKSFTERYDAHTVALASLDARSQSRPADVLVELSDHVTRAEALLNDLEREIRNEHRKLQRRKIFEERKAETETHLQNILTKGGPRPDTIWTRLNAITTGDDYAPALRELEPVFHLARQLDWLHDELGKMPIPVQLSPEDTTLAKDWRDKAIAAIKAGDEVTTKKELDKYKTLVIGQASRERVQKELSGIDPDEAYRKRILQIQDVLEYPANFRSAALDTEIEKVRTANAAYLISEASYCAARENKRNLSADAARLKQSTVRYVEAEKRKDAQDALRQLEQVLKPTASLVAAHNKHVSPYYRDLKKLWSRIDLAGSLPLTDAGADTPWKSEREAVDLKKAELKTAVDQPSRNYKKARALLVDLEKLIKALVDKKIKQVGAQVDTADNGARAQTLVNQLAASTGLITAMTGQQQLKLLETLRTKAVQCETCKKSWPVGSTECLDTNCGSSNLTDLITAEEVKAARIKMFSQMKLDPKFEEWDKKKREATIKAIRKLPEFKEADQLFPDDAKKRTKWQVWAANPRKYKAQLVAMFEKCLAAHCKTLGHDQKNLTREGSKETWPDRPVKVALKNMDPDLFGGCTPGFPTWIEINMQNPQFSDFKEMVDTVVHENTHAWQEWVIAVLEGKKPFDDAAGQRKKAEILANSDIAIHARLLQENDKTYYDSDDDRGAYRHETIEEQAWRTGGMVSTRLLVPPPVESFESKNTTVSKTYMIESISRETRCVVKLRERHGIYVDEWEGEKAEDKDLILENLRDADGTVEVPKSVKIVNVIDEFTLRLKCNTNSYRAKEGDASQVTCDGAVLRLKELVREL